MLHVPTSPPTPSTRLAECCSLWVSTPITASTTPVSIDMLPSSEGGAIWCRPGKGGSERQSCKESRRVGGQASDQAMCSGFRVGTRHDRQTCLRQGTHRLRGLGRGESCRACW